MRLIRGLTIDDGIISVSFMESDEVRPAVMLTRTAMIKQGDNAKLDAAIATVQESLDGLLESAFFYFQNTPPELLPDEDDEMGSAHG